ncbi:MAG: right-handed parallel beta-helix repeat-containing protein, partial [Kiritimatiellae bacterium]|nr:right-handed parallel beta-helix repeat-containing protein [Kiritimatiellia bacterium]
VTNNVVFRSAEGRATTILKAVNPNGTKKNGSIIKRRVLYVNASGALVEGFTLTDGYWYNAGSQNTDYLSSNIGGGDLVLKNGTVRDCIITGVSNGGTYGGGVNMSGGTITNCIIRGNNAQYNNQTTGLGGGVYMSSGLVVDCVITNNSSGQFGSGVYLDGGTLRNCLVAGNKGLQRLGVTGAIYQNKASVVENCVVKDHTSNHARAGLYLNHANAIARNTLVCGNTGVYSGQGAYVANGQIQNCTLADNTSQFDSTGAGLYQSAGTIVNTIVSGGGVDKPSYISVASGATFKTNLTDAAVSTSSATVADNLHGDSRFADAAQGDYRLRFDSPAVGAAQPLASVKTDLANVARTSTPSIGCYEYVPTGALCCSFILPETRLGAGGSFTATAVVEGASGDATYAWYLDGVLQECTSAVFDFSAPATVGAHALRLVVSSGGESASYEEAAAFAVLPTVTYANINGSDTFPYDTREKGAHHLQDAVDACWCADNAPGTVIVAPGTYPVDGIWTRIQKAIRVVSEDGPATTILKAKN